MPVTARPGLTLVDVLVAMVLFGIIGTVATRAVLALERTVRGAADRAKLENGFETVLTLFASELSEAGPGDLIVSHHDSLTYRAMRGRGLACLVRSSEIRLLAERFVTTRRPQPARDSLLVYSGVDREAGRSWLAAPIQSVGNATCNGRAALSIGTGLDSTRLLVSDTTETLVPVQTFEVMQLRLYRSLGEWWMGARSVSSGEAIQPLAGPFDAPASGFTYRDSTGAPPAGPGAIRSIRLELFGQGAAWNGGMNRYRDSAGLTLEPRNLRP